MATDLHVERLGNGGDLVVFVHGSGDTGASSFREQFVLAGTFELAILDRRGFGASPPTSRVDWAPDTDDLTDLLHDRPAHLVGHSYGTIACLGAALRTPENVRSLVLVEPSTYSVAAEHPSVVPVLRGLRALADRAGELSAEEYLTGILAVWGFLADDAPTLGRLPDDQRAAVRASALERPPWEATFSLSDLAALSIPSLIVMGRWNKAPDLARAKLGAALYAIADVLQEALGARRAVIVDADHWPHQTGPPFNDVLVEFLATAARTR